MPRATLAQIDGVPTLPTIDAGLTILETPAETRAIGPLDSLVLDHLLCHTGDAVWVDSGGHATTQHLGRIAPSKRFLERIRVARGFTAYQHYSLIECLDEIVTSQTSLVVVPWLDALYRDGDLTDSEATQMIDAVVGRLGTVARRAEVPILLTRRQADSLTTAVSDQGVRTIEYRQTRFGPRFVGEEFETLVYEGNGYLQTTLAFWRHILEQRYDAREQLRAATEEVA